MADDTSLPRSTTTRSVPRSLPEGTVTLSVERLVADSHQRGGRREPVGRVVPAQLDALLATLSPGRYRVACLNARTHFIRRGVYVVEVAPDTLSPRFVPARTSRDYPAQPSPLLRARRKEREAVGRVELLRQRMRTVERENARLLRDGAKQEADHLAERVSEAEVLRRLADEVDRLSRQMSELRAEAEGRDRELRVSINTALAQQEARMEQRVEGLAAWIMESFASGPSDLSVEQVAEVEVTTAPMNTAGPLPPGPGMTGEPSGARPGLAGGMATLANVRNVPRDRRPLVEGAEQPTTRPGTLVQLERFLRREPPAR